MTTARSSFSFSRVLPFYRNMLRRHRGSALFYGALGFLFLPVQYLLTILQNQDRADLSNFVRWTFSGPAQIYNGFSAFFFTALMLVHWKRNPTTCRLCLGGTFLSVKRLNYRQR